MCVCVCVCVRARARAQYFKILQVVYADSELRCPASTEAGRSIFRYCVPLSAHSASVQCCRLHDSRDGLHLADAVTHSRPAAGAKKAKLTAAECAVLPVTPFVLTPYLECSNHLVRSCNHLAVPGEKGG